MIREIHLHGDLKKRFGGPFKMDVESAGEAGRALASQLPGFRAEVVGNDYKVVRGSFNKGLEIGPEELEFKLGRAPLHIAPVISGSKNQGVSKIIIGAALIGLAFVTGGVSAGGLGALGNSALSVGGATLLTYGNIAAIGFAIALGGASMLISPTPTSQGVTTTEQKASFLFSGPANTSEQGGPVPLVYGRMRVGSTVISAGLVTEYISTVDGSVNTTPIETFPLGGSSAVKSSIFAATLEQIEARKAARFPLS